MQIFFRGKYGKLYNLEAETPQGSVLSPLLYILLNNDIPALKYCTVSQFVGDIAIWTTWNNTNITTTTNHLQNALRTWKLLLQMASQILQNPSWSTLEKK